MFGGLQVDNDQFATFTLGEERKVSTGFDLQGGAQRQCQVCSSGCRQLKKRSGINKKCDIFACFSLREIYSFKSCISYIIGYCASKNQNMRTSWTGVNSLGLFYEFHIPLEVVGHDDNIK